MPIAKFSSLRNLISSLNKAEKRHFVLYANRLDSNEMALYLKLFHLIDKSPEKDESYFLAKISPDNKMQFLNTKRHLYGQLLRSLRLQHNERHPEMSIRQRLDYATLLYERGFSNESLAILRSIKPPLVDQYNILSLEVLELQKRIESRHITRSRLSKNRIESLMKRSLAKQKLIDVVTTMSNVSLEIQGLYIKWGFAKSERDAQMYKVYFENRMPSYSFVNMSPLAAVLWMQSCMWYNYMNLNFHFAYRYAVKWILKMDSDEKLLRSDPDLYMRGMHYVLTTCFYLGRMDKFIYWFEKYKLWRKKYATGFNLASRLLDFCYFENAELNNKILTNKYSRFTASVHQLNASIVGFEGRLDVHRQLMFYYKLGMIFSYRGEMDKAVDYFNKVIDDHELHLREDIFSYARLTQLMCHYRLGNFNLVLNLLNSVKTNFENNGLMNQVVETMLVFLRRGSRSMNFGINELLETSIKKLEHLQKDRFDRAAYMYYDFIGWVKSIRNNSSIEEMKKAQV